MLFREMEKVEHGLDPINVSRDPRDESLAPVLWDPVAVTVLNAPVALALVILGAFLLLVGRKKKPLIGYARS